MSRSRDYSTRLSYSLSEYFLGPCRLVAECFRPMSPQPHTPHEEGIMAQTSWCSFVDNLDDNQFYQLYQYVLAASSTRGFPAFSVTNGPVYGLFVSSTFSSNANLYSPANDIIDMRDSDFVSPSPTLQPSRRSSCQSTSVYCKDFANLDPVTSAYPPFEIQNPTVRQKDHNTSRGRARTEAEARTSASSSLRKVSQSHTADKATPSLKSTKSSNQPHVQSNSPFFCTYCCELNVKITFTTKQDWKRHELKFHETGFAWHCSFKNCLEVFSREKELKSHSTIVHRCKQYPRSIKYAAPAKVVYACGFANCRRLAFSWKDRCDHVARCMSTGSGDWKLTRRILNLLQHPDVSPSWKIIKSRWCKQLGLDASDLNWDLKTSRIMLQQLECHTFETELESFLERLLKLGHPIYTVSQNFGMRHVEPKPLPLPPTGADSNFEAQNTCTEFHQSIQNDNMISYADQRHPGFENDSLGDHSMEDQKRQSIMMVDAPELSTNSAGYPYMGFADQAADQALLTFTDMIQTIPYSTNMTPPLSATTSQSFDNPDTETTRPSPRLNLVRRSKEWLTQKKSQQFQPRVATDHSDLTVNYPLPIPLPRDVSSTCNTFTVSTYTAINLMTALTAKLESHSQPIVVDIGKYYPRSFALDIIEFPNL